VQAAPFVQEMERERAASARRTLFVCGVLCRLGTVGPVVGSMHLQLVGVAGYAVLPRRLGPQDQEVA